MRTVATLGMKLWGCTAKLFVGNHASTMRLWYGDLFCGSRLRSASPLTRLVEALTAVRMSCVVQERGGGVVFLPLVAVVCLYVTVTRSPWRDPSLMRVFSRSERRVVSYSLVVS